MSGGFGGSGWGSVPWGGSEVDIQAGGLIDVFAGDVVNVTDSPAPTVFRAHSDTLGIVDDFSYDIPLRVSEAFAPSPFSVQVLFSNNLDFSYPPLVQASNYSIPGLTVTSATIVGDNAVLLTTTPGQLNILYTVTVALALSLNGDALGTDHTATFLGFVQIPSFLVGAQAKRQVEVVFTTAMLIDAAFLSPSNYLIREAEGSTVVSVLSVVPSGDEPLRRATLHLGTDLKSKEYYSLVVNSAIKSVIGFSVTPDTYIFQWGDMTQPLVGSPLEIPIRDFSGEVTSGLLGAPDGQVFFSPALLASVLANSVLEVESISVCTQAEDHYSFPDTPDPVPLFTFGKGVASVIGPTSVLWAPAARLGQIKFNLKPLFADVLDLVVFDGPAYGTLSETILSTVGGFLNDPLWLMGGSYDVSSVSGHTSTIGDTVSTVESLTVERITPSFTATRSNPTPKLFTLANNTSPVGPGPTQNVTLQWPDIHVLDSLALTDTTVINIQDIEIAQDSVSITDQTALTGVVGFVLGDAVAATDTLSVVTSYVRAPSTDPVIVTDTISVQKL